MWKKEVYEGDKKKVKELFEGEKKMEEMEIIISVVNEDFDKVKNEWKKVIILVEIE